MKRNSKILFVMAGIVAVLAIILYSCGGGGGGGYGGGSSYVPPMGTGPVATGTVQVVACPGTTMVSIVSMAAPGYSPSSVTVALNTVVEWTNNDTTGTAHTVTSTSTVPTGLATFDSGQLAQGAKVCLKFTVAGTYNYHCTNHPTTMIGAITVQ